MTRKKHRDGVIKQNDYTNQQPRIPLFSEVDAKSVEVSGYTVGPGAPQIDKSMYEHSIPTGVVDIDESVVFPKSSLNFDQQYDSKPSKSTQYTHHKHDKKHFHLPPITHHHHQHYPNENFNIQPSYHHLEHSYLPRPIHYRHQSFQHDHHRHRETYDPRWWYMPINSVHGPKYQRFINHHHHHYRPPKWYELPSRH